MGIVRRLVEQLGRRKVFKVAAAYAIVGFALVLAWVFDVMPQGIRARRAIDPSDPATLYNVACFYAQAGRIDDALECLENGLTSKTWLRNDPELDPVREHPRFKALLGRQT